MEWSLLSSRVIADIGVPDLAFVVLGIMKSKEATQVRVVVERSAWRRVPLMSWKNTCCTPSDEVSAANEESLCIPWIKFDVVEFVGGASAVLDF